MNQVLRTQSEEHILLIQKLFELSQPNIKQASEMDYHNICQQLSEQTFCSQANKQFRFDNSCVNFLSLLPLHSLTNSLIL